jgi:WD40 repeat protein
MILVSGSLDQSVCVWNFSTGRTMRIETLSDVHDVAVDGETIVVATAGGLVGILLSTSARDVAAPSSPAGCTGKRPIRA